MALLDKLSEDLKAAMKSGEKIRVETIYLNAGRPELAEKESAELAVISSYLPQALEPAEIEALVTAAIQETGAKGAGDLGKVMGKIMPQIKGRADGKVVQQLVRQRLG
jgi:uncharacterized protein YqeY